MDLKVTRDGVVTVDGTTVGHVKKEMRQGLFATAFGISSSSGGTPYWIPFADDGTCLSETGYDTRKRAVSLIVKHAEPLSVTDLRLEYGLGSNDQCVTAGVRFKGYYFGVSRYANESVWVVDMLCAPGAFMPTFANGTGSRCTRVQALQGELAQAATDAAIAAGLWPIEGSAV